MTLREYVLLSVLPAIAIVGIVGAGFSIDVATNQSDPSAAVCATAAPPSFCDEVLLDCMNGVAKGQQATTGACILLRTGARCGPTVTPTP